jgi:hypothetical protein
LRASIRGLVVAALGLPVVQAVLTWVGALLSGMGDEQGAAVVRGIGTACLIVWTIALVALMILVAIVVGNDERQGPRVERQEPEEEL